MPDHDSNVKERLRSLPSVDSMLLSMQAEIEQYGHKSLTEALRAVLSEQREHVLSGAAHTISETKIKQAAIHILEESEQPSLRPGFNLTGTVLHTNLGRAILPSTALAAIQTVAAGHSNLEFDLSTGSRGDRESHVEDLICELTGAEAATVVNNNAAAVLLVLNTLAMNKEVPVSRGELVEIGGSFRIPEVMQRANCALVEVGATNRTHLKDYSAAINSNTALLMKVHTSNYVIEGFTEEVSEADLAKLAAKHQLPFVMDLGSGSLVDFSQFNLPAEPTAAYMLQQGADIITFSGDKLLGGPQSGLIAGRADLIAQIKSNPLKRALRLDKMTLAGMAEVLKLYRNPEKLCEVLPTLQHLTRSLTEIQRLAERLAPAMNDALGTRLHVSVVETNSQIGSGSMPTKTVPSAAVAIQSATQGEDLSQSIAEAFRKLPQPVIGHINKGRVILDLRCIDDEVECINQLSALQL